MTHSYINRLFINRLVIIGLTMFHAHGLLATEPEPPIQTTLSLDSHPPLGEPAQLTCEITSIIDAQATEAYIELPPDTKVLYGDLNWKGELVAHEMVQFSVSIVFETGGQKEIFCRVKVTGETAPYDALAGLASLDLFVGQIKSELGYPPTPCEIAESFAHPPESGPPGLPSSSCFHYSGIWQDENNPKNYYSIHRNEESLIMIDLSHLITTGQPLTATYMGEKTDYVYVLTPLAPTSIEVDGQTHRSLFSLEITFISNTKAVISPICEVCSVVIVNIHKVFSNVEKERTGSGLW